MYRMHTTQQSTFGQVKVCRWALSDAIMAAFNVFSSCEVFLGLLFNNIILFRCWVSVNVTTTALVQKESAKNFSKLSESF